MGPTYCETPTLLNGFPLEPINAWSNLFIIALGVTALVFVARRPAKTGGTGLFALALLLTLTGFGSFLWHGWRTSTFLAFDALPGGLFLLTCIYVWIRRFHGRWSTFWIFFAFITLEALSILFGVELFKTTLLFVSIAPLIIILGAWLVAQTYLESKRAAALGGGALLLAILALAFRSIDLSICPTIPIGTHFLWHILLSLGALLLILMFIIIDYARLFTAPLPTNHISLRPTRRAPPPPPRTTLHI